jgi:hypothetical protein
VQGAGCRVQGSGLHLHAAERPGRDPDRNLVQGPGLRVQNWASGFGSRVWASNFGFRASGFGVGVSGFAFGFWDRDRNHCLVNHRLDHEHVRAA